MLWPPEQEGLSMEGKEAILPSYLEGEGLNLVTGLFPSLFSSFTASTSKLAVVV